MSHDFVGLVVLDGAICTIGLLIHLHSIVTSALALFFFLDLLVLTAAALTLKILTALVFRLYGSGVNFSTSHLGVVNHGIWISSGFTLDTLCFFLFELLCTIFFSVGVQIGLWLVGREFSGGRIIGVPA